ncbi:MAG: transglycosylase SLT domain-containing protein, partial [Hyphomicrobiaceae bacterium]|nr:transglycosylase SLT domain-containing protein [Hyphomicrobiaceae bacterium]
IALRYLKDANAAEKYFAAYTKSADGPLSRAKSNYWLARALEAKGNSELAAQHYRAAARERGTFHGLLAAQKLDPGRKSFPITAPAEPTPQQIARFNELDVVKAVAIAHKSKAGRSIARIFLHHIRTLEENEAWSAMVAHLAREIGDTQTSVRIGKAAIARGQNLIYYSYPVHALPDYKPLRSPPETAFLLGLARQETEFNTQIVSGAGARGILQVMKATARHVCRDYKIKCSNKRLLTDPSYNTMIASAYVADRLRDFSGSYVLGLSSYNAGPGRTRQWIREFGDPRTSKIDPIDWIERIPIKETRRYVAKVLANIQVYRARLGDEATALRISTDLNRARAASAPSRQKKSGGRTNTVKTGG